MRFGSLFAGIEGFGLGLERAGMQCVYQVEINEQCRSVLERHWPDVPRYKDVTKFHATDAVRPDLICGGFPCPDLSVAGRRAGLAGERSGLFYEFMRVVGESTPRWVLIENVPGLLSSNGGRDMGAVLGKLGKLGYGYAYRVLDAQFFGVPQRRRRVFIVGCLGDVRRAAEVLFERDCLPWDSPPSREAGARVAHAIARGTGSSGYRLDANGEDFVSHPLKAGGNLRHDESHDTYVTHTLRAEGFAYTLEARHHVQSVGFAQNQRGELREMEIAGAIAAEPGMNQQTFVRTKMGVRRLMPIECERLQGFPDNWTALGHDGKAMSDSARYRMLGNAVVPQVSEYIARRILAAREERE